MKSYLIVFNDQFSERDDLTNFVDAIPEIINWRTDMPGCLMVVSELSAREIAQHLSELNEKRDGQKKGYFLVSEVGTNKQGWLPKPAWRLMNEKHAPGK